MRVPEHALLKNSVRVSMVAAVTEKERRCTRTAILASATAACGLVLIRYVKESAMLMVLCTSPLSMDITTSLARLIAIYELTNTLVN